MAAAARTLMETIKALPPHRLREVENFVDFLRMREQERASVRDAAAASVPAFAAAWDNPEDDVYNAP